MHPHAPRMAECGGFLGTQVDSWDWPHSCIVVFSISILKVYYLLFGDQVLMCSPAWPETCYVDQLGHKLTEIHQSLPPERWIEGVQHQAWLKIYF